MRTPRRSGTGWTLTAVLLVSLNLRISIAGVSPVLDSVRVDLGLSRGTAGLLTTLPVLCFGVLAPVSAHLGRRFGNELTLAAAMACLTAGILVRSAGGTVLLFAGTVLLGAGIAAGNVLVPTLVKQDLNAIAGTAMALYTAFLTGGAALAAAGTAALVSGGWSWPWALAAGAVPALLGTVVMLARARDRLSPRSTAAAAPTLPSVRVWQSATAWQLAAYFGGQSLMFYSVLAWLPGLLQDDGVSLSVSGGMLSLYSLLGIVGALAIPPLAVRRPDQRLVACLCAAGWVAGILGLLVATDWYLLWTVVLGVTQGAGIAMGLTLIVLRSRDDAVARDLSGMVQMTGYLVAALGPLATGALRDLTDGWTGSLVLLLVVALVMLGSGLGVGRHRMVV